MTTPGPAPGAGPTDAGVAPADRERLLDFEGYRGIAALLIVVFHVYQHARAPGYPYEGRPVHLVLHQLDGAVAWFFALSGFLLYRELVRANLDRTHQASARGFLLRRAIRILPVYIVAVCLVWLLNNPRLPGDWEDLVLHLTFTHVFDAKRIFYTIGPAWSLAVEVMFYVLLGALAPLLYRWCRRLRYRRSRGTVLVSVPVVFAVTSLVFKAWAWYGADIPSTNYPVYFGPLARLDAFAFGMLVAALSVAAADWRLPRGGPVAMRLLAFTVLVAALVTRGSDDLHQNPFFHTWSGLAMSFVLASSVFAARQARWERVLGSGPLIFIGMISYSLYLWHEPVLVELSRAGFINPQAFVPNVAILILVSLAVGTLSYWLIEFPAMHLQYAFTPEGHLVVPRRRERRSDSRRPSTITLPSSPERPVSPAPPVASEADQPPENGRATNRLLLVSHDPSERAMLKSLFDAAGWRVDEATSGGAAVLRLLDDGAVDAVVASDDEAGALAVPLVRWIREWLGRRDLPIVVLSPRSSPERVARALTTGGDIVLAKPVNLGVLQRSVAALGDGRQSVRSEARQTGRSASPG